MIHCPDVHKPVVPLVLCNIPLDCFNWIYKIIFQTGNETVSTSFPHWNHTKDLFYITDKPHRKWAMFGSFLGERYCFQSLRDVGSEDSYLFSLESKKGNWSISKGWYLGKLINLSSLRHVIGKNGGCSEAEQ